MGEHVGEMLGAITEISFDGAEDGVLVQVILNHGGDVGVDGFVIGYAVAGGVGEGDVASAVRAHQAGDTEHGIGAETEWVEEIVVDAAIDYVDAFEAVDGFHVDDDAVYDQIAALYQLNAHLLG